MAEPVVGISTELILLGDQFSKEFEKELSRSQDSAKRFEKQVQGAFDKITGTKATQQAEILAKGLARVGDVSKLTGNQIDNLRADIERLAKAGAKLPASLKIPQLSGGGLGQIGANIQTQGLSAVQGQLGPLGGLLSGVTGGALAAGAAVGVFAVGVGAAASATAAAVSEFANFSSNLQNLSAQTGIGVVALQELEFAGSFVGVSMGEITSAVGKMQKAIVAGDDVFGRLGLSLEELKALAPEDQFAAVAQAIAGIPDPAQRSAFAMEVFGKSGAALLPLLGNLEALQEEFRRLGIAIDADAIAKGAELDDATKKLEKTWQALKLQFAAAFVDSGVINAVGLLTEAVATANTGVKTLGGGFLDLISVVGTLAGPLGQVASSLAQIGDVASIAGLLGGVGALPEVSFGKEAAAAGAFAPTFGANAPSGAIRLPGSAELEREEQLLRDIRLREQEAAAEAKKFAEALKQSRIEAFELEKQIEQVGDAAAEGLGEALFGASTEGLFALPEAAINVSAEDMAAAEAGMAAVARALEDKAGAEEKAKQAAERHAQALEQLASNLSGVGFVLGNLGGLFEALGVSADSGLSKAVSGLQGLASSAAGVASSLAKGDLLGAIGSGIEGAKQIAGAIKKLFGGKSDAQKAAEIGGRVLGVSISKGLGEEISKLSKQLNIPKELAALLSIGSAIDESGAAAASFAPKMGNLLDAIASGSVPASEGIEALGEAFSKLAEDAEAGSVAAMASMGGLAAQARALGQSIPEIDAAVADAVGASTGALGGLGGITLVDEADARAQAQIFVNVFSGVLATEGIVAAAQAIQPALKTFTEQLSAAGIGKGAADAILGPINQAMSLLKNDMTKGGAEGAQALKTILESQLKAGFLDTNTFAAIQQQAGTAFDQMIKGGADTGAALQAIAPLLAQIQQTAQATGQAIDPVTQGLIDQAGAAGIAFPTEPIQQVVTLLESIAVALGATIPEKTTTAATTLQTALPAAASVASDSLGGLALAAGESSASMLSAFSGVGVEITSQITPAAAGIESQFATAFQSATNDAAAFISTLGGISGTQIPLSFSFRGEGGIPQFQGGTQGIPDFGSGTLAMLHGKEGVFTVPQLQEMLAGALRAGAAASGSRGDGGERRITLEVDGKVLSEVNTRHLRRNTGGSQTQIRRGYR